jgi:hypothetical protein
MKTDDDIDKFIKLVKQIKGLILEFSVLSKKKPDDAVNKFKIKLINPVLEVANYFVSDKKYKPFADFELFREDDLPTNSDILVILSQYNACLEKYFEDSINYYERKYWWIVDESISDIEAPGEYEGV